MSNLYINFADFDPARVVETVVQQKQSKPKHDPNNPAAAPSPVSYNELPIQYRYDVKDPKTGKVIGQTMGPLYIEGPELLSMQGITTKDMQGGPVTSIMTVFDLTDPAQRSFVAIDPDAPGTMEQLYRVLLKIIFQQKGSISSFARLSSDGLEGVFPPPIHWYRDPKTGQVIEGKNPSKWWKLFSYGKPGTPERRETCFRYPIIDQKTKEYLRESWDKLRGSQIRFVPLFHFPTVYIGGGKASLQAKMVSAVIKSIVPGSHVSQQDPTLQDLSQDEGLIKKLQEQRELLELAFAGSKDPSASVAPSGVPPQGKEEKHPAPESGAPRGGEGAISHPATPAPAFSSPQHVGEIPSLPVVSSLPPLPPSLPALPPLSATSGAPMNLQSFMS